MKTGVLNNTTGGETGYWIHIDTHDISLVVARATDEFPHEYITRPSVPSQQESLRGRGS